MEAAKRGEILALFTAKKIGFDTFMAEIVNMTYGKSICCVRLQHRRCQGCD